MKISTSHQPALLILLWHLVFSASIVNGQDMETLANFKVTNYYVNDIDSSTFIADKGIHYVFYMPQDHSIGLAIYSDSNERQIYGPILTKPTHYTKARINKKMNHMYHFQWEYADTHSEDFGNAQLMIVEIRVRLKKHYMLIIDYSENLRHVYIGETDGKMKFLSRKPYKVVTGKGID